MSLKDYIFIARPDHWFKNVFVLPGVVVAAYLTHAKFSDYGWNLILGFVSVCLIASANYTINEWLDAEFDKYHPVKSKRPSAAGRVEAKWVYVQYVILAAAGLGLAYVVSKPFLIAAAILLGMGILYNVKPFRSKDLPFVDVLSESVNNPLRLYLGWFMVTSTPLPPSSLVLAYWMAGAFLMAVKRYTELAFLADKNLAALYRRSFRYYTPGLLLASILFYAMTFSFFFGVFLVKHKIELLLALPLFFIMFGWYLFMGLKPESATKSPEKIYREGKFLAFLLLIVLTCAILLYTKVPQLNFFLQNNFSQ